MYYEYRVRQANFLFHMAFHIQKRKLACHTLYKRTVMCMQHGNVLRNALFNCVFTVVTRCTLLPMGVCLYRPKHVVLYTL
jgi:sulfite exporter TauE/SafE